MRKLSKEEMIPLEKLRELNKKKKMRDDEFFREMIDFLPKMSATNNAILTFAVFCHFVFYAMLGFVVLIILAYIGLEFLPTKLHDSPISSILKMWFAGLITRGVIVMVTKKSPEWDF